MRLENSWKPPAYSVLFASHWTADLHFAPSDRQPLVAADVEPRQSKTVLSVQVRVLTPRIPPSSFVIGRTVGRAVVVVAVGRAEPMAVLEGQSVGRVAVVPGNVEPITGVAVRYRKMLVVCQPIVAVDVGHLDAQGRRVVRRQPVDGLVTEPEISYNNIICESVARYKCMNVEKIVQLAINRALRIQIFFFFFNITLHWIPKFKIVFHRFVQRVKVALL